MREPTFIDVIKNEPKDVLKVTVADILEEYLKDFIRIAVRGINDWERTFVLDPDFSTEERKKIYPRSELRVDQNGINNVNDYYTAAYAVIQRERTEYSKRPNDLIDMLDLAGCAKLIRFRLGNNKFRTPDPVYECGGFFNKALFSKPYDDNSPSFIASVQELRNVNAHGTDAYSFSEAADELKPIIQKLEAAFDPSQRHSNSFNRQKSQEIKVLTEETLKTLKKLTEYLLIASEPRITQSRVDSIPAMELYPYHVFLDSRIFQGKYALEFLNSLEDYAVNGWKYYIDKLSFDDIRAYCGNKDEAVKKKAIETIRRLSSDMDSNPAKAAPIELAENWLEGVSEMTDFVRELQADMQLEEKGKALILQLSQKTSPFCVVTDDEHLAGWIWRTGENHAAVRIEKRNKVRVLCGLPELFTVIEEDEPEVIDMPKAAETQQKSEPILLRWEEQAQKQPEPSAPVSTSAPMGNQRPNTPTRERPIRIPKAGEWVKLYDAYGSLGDQSEEQMGKAFSSGGEGTVFRLPRKPNDCLKLLKADRLNSDDGFSSRIQHWVQNDPHIEGLLWPELYVTSTYDTRHIIGYIMPLAGAADGQETVQTCESLISSAIIEHMDSTDWTRYDLAELCIRCLRVFEQMHDKNILMGDVNPKNILVGRTNSDIRVYFIDTDSYQFGDYRCLVGRPEYAPPRLQRMNCNFKEVIRTLADERFSIAVLLFFILMLGMPYDSDTSVSVGEKIRRGEFRYKEDYWEQTRHNYRWGNLSPKLQGMFRDAFQRNPKVYSEGEWIHAMLEYQDDLLSDNNPDGRYSNEIDPMDAPKAESEDVHWREIRCYDCRRTCLTTRPEGDNNPFYCSRCNQRRMVLRARIYKLKCKKCGMPFTVNEYDYLKNLSDDTFDTDNVLCPDCDTSLRFPRDGEWKNESDENNTVNDFLSKALRNIYINRNA